MFTSREQASCILLATLALTCLVMPGVRTAVWAVVRTLLQPKVAVALALFTCAVAAAVVLASSVEVWTTELTGATVLWFLFTGSSLFINVTNAGRDDRFFRNRAAETVKIGAFIEFFLNLRTFSMPVEIALQLMLALVVLVQLLTSDPSTKRVLAFLVGGFGLTMVGLTVAHLIDRWDELEKLALLRLLALPVWLTLAALAAVFVIALYAEYELAFLRMRFANDMEAAPAGAKLPVILKLRGRLRFVRQFGGKWPSRVLDAPHLKARVAVLTAYRRRVRR